MLRWLYHVLPAGDDVGDPYTPASLLREGFVHCSFIDRVVQSARLYFPRDALLTVLQIDPRGLDVRVVATPRGPMPHVHQAIPRSAVVRRWTIDQLRAAPDEVGGLDGSG